jgi:hypothetical protein
VIDNRSLCFIEGHLGRHEIKKNLHVKYIISKTVRLFSCNTFGTLHVELFSPWRATEDFDTSHDISGMVLILKSFETSPNLVLSRMLK